MTITSLQLTPITTIRYHAYFSYPSLIRRPRCLSSLWNFRARLSVRKLESWGYSVVKVAWS